MCTVNRHVNALIVHGHGLVDVIFCTCHSTCHSARNRAAQCTRLMPK